MPEINFNGRVDKQNVDSLIQSVEGFIIQGELNIIVNFDTAGGILTEAINGYKKLINYSDKLTMNNLANTDSAGVLLFCSGSIRTCNSNAGFLIHSAFTLNFNYQTASRVQILNHERGVADLNVYQAEAISYTTKEDIKLILSWIYALPNGKPLTPQEAHTYNLIQTINTTPIVPSANSITIP